VLVIYNETRVITTLPETQPKSRRWTVLASGLLCGLLALVVIFTNRSAFHSPVAVVVVAAIGFAAVLLQLRMRNREQGKAVHPPIWLNLLGIVFALIALFADFLRLKPEITQLIALAAVGSFGISGAIILHAFRKNRMAGK
jgi:drug/metabolite transporter (DMT)-like permease